MTWVKAEYEFASMFSYRVPNFSPSFALSSPLPGPSAIKLAIVSIAIERGGKQQGEEIFEIIKNSKVLVEPPERVALSKSLIKRLKQEIIDKKMQKDKKETGICSRCNENKEVWKIDNKLICKDCARNKITSTFGTRQYVHFSGPINIFIKVDDAKKEKLKDILRKIKYFGTSDSLVFCKSITEELPDENTCIKLLKPMVSKETMVIGDFALLLADLKENIQFKDVNPYEKVRNRDPFSLSPYVFPLKLESEGKNWVIYSKIKNKFH